MVAVSIIAKILMVAMFADATKDFSLTAMENPAQVTFTQVAV